MIFLNKNRSLPSRIRHIAERVGGIKKLAGLAQLSRSTLDNYIYGRSEPAASILVNLADSAGVSLEWLVAGRGAMRPANGVDPTEFLLIRHYDLAPAAVALPDQETAPGLLALNRDWARRQFGLESANLAVITPPENGMPTVISGADFLLVDLSVTDLRGDGIYVHRRRSELRVKRLTPLPSGALIVDSARPEDPIETLSPGFDHGLEIVARVVMILRPV